MLKSIPSKDFLEDVKNRLRMKVAPMTAITEDDIEGIVKEAGSMPLPFLKKLAQEDSLVCERCGTCCRKCTPIVVTKREIKTVAKYLGTSPSKLRKKYNIIRTGKNNLWQMVGAPCPFLKGKNECIIHPARFQVCRDFPFKRMYFEGATAKQVGVYPSCSIVREAMARFYMSKLIAKKFRRNLTPLQIVKVV